MPDTPPTGSRSGLNIPNPDPSLLTTAEILREVGTLRAQTGTKYFMAA